MSDWPPKDDFYGREKYDFTHRVVDIRDEQVTMDEMARDGWSFHSKDYDRAVNANAGVRLTFFKEKAV